MKIFGVCGGNGVLLYPMRRYLMGNVEIRSVFKTPNNEQWKLNFGDIPLITNGEYATSLGIPDVIVGAPNCGHSSMLAYSRAKQLSDPLKDESLELFIILLKLYQPKIFMMENLPKMLDMVPEKVFYNSFPDYQFIFHRGSVNGWGNSQNYRNRLVIIGLNKKYFGEEVTKLRYHFSNVYKVNELKTCKDLLINLPEDGHFREDINEIITMYSGFKISLKEAQQFWLENPNLKRWPVNDRKFTTAPGVYRNLDKDYPAVARKANRQFNQKGLQMSPRELARIQGIPDTFKISYSHDRKTFYINKGRATVTKTPPYEIGRWFYRQLIKIKPWIS